MNLPLEIMKQTLLLLVFFPAMLLSQIQVSEIQYNLPRDDYAYKGFLKDGEVEYFIEQGIRGTRVYLVNNQNLEFKHELKFRPGDSSLNRYAYSYENSNSGLIYEGTHLYELYWDYIYLVDIATGELIQKVDLKDLGIRLQRNFSFGNNYYYFSAQGEGWAGHVRLDRNSGTIDTVSNFGILSGSRIYRVSDDSTRLVYYDLETRETKDHTFNFSQIQSISVPESIPDTPLIIREENAIYFLRMDDSIDIVECGLSANSPGYISESRVAYAGMNGNNRVVSIVDLQTCSVVYEQILPDDYYYSAVQFYTNEQLHDQYFIFGIPNDWQGDGVFYLFDIDQNRAVPIDIPIDFPMLERSVRYGNSLYFLSSNHLHHEGSFPELYRLDLQSYEARRIDRRDIFSTLDIVIGESSDDRILNVYESFADSTRLYQIDDLQQDYTNLAEFDLNQNHGIHFNIYADLWARDKYFFSSSEAIFVLHDGITEKITDVGPNVHGTSAFKRKGDHVYVLTGMEDGHYAIKINIDNLGFSKIYLPGVEYLYYERVVSENAIVNLSHVSFYESSLGFFDLDLERFYTFQQLGLPRGTPESKSGNNILYQTTLSNGSEWYLVNTVTREVKLAEISAKTYPDVYPDGNGGFYLNDLEESGMVSFGYLDPDGKLNIIYEGFDYRVFSGGDRFEDNVKSLAFDGDGELIIISALGAQIRRKSIPNYGLLYYQPFFWYESDQRSFLELYNGQAYDTFSFGFDSEPARITESGRNERLLAVMEYDTFAVLVYKSRNDILSFDKHTYGSTGLEQLFEMASVRNNAVGDQPIKIDAWRYLISLNDGIHGLEPWVFDAEENHVYLLEDINEDHSSSNLDDITIHPETGDIYFSAVKTEGDRQLFRLDLELSNVQEVIQEVPGNILIYPNPAYDMIQLDRDYREVFIYDMQGRPVLQRAPYEQGEPLFVGDLPSGFYTLVALNASGRNSQGKFIITNRNN